MTVLNQSPIGREREQAEIEMALEAARRGQGRLVLVSGEAGIGKTFLVRSVLAASTLQILSSAANQGATAPYAPLAGVLRSYLRVEPGGLAGCGRLQDYLALLLPELGPASPGGDAAALLESIRCAVRAIAQRPTVIFLDDLQWADSATLETLAGLAETLEQGAAVIIAAYRSDEIPREHPLRRLRAELRRQDRLHEIALPTLDYAGTVALAAGRLGGPLGPQLAAQLHTHTEGIPFFVEEIAAALAAGGRLRSTKAGFELVVGQALPFPESVRDAVLLRLAAFSTRAREALEVAAVAGQRFELELIAECLDDDEGLGEALETGLIVASETDQAEFRHALIREAVYGTITWSRRRRLHRQIAEWLAAREGSASSLALAEHWLAAHELRRGRLALLALAERWSGVHAYRDAAAAIKRALEIWPADEDEPLRLTSLERLGMCSQLCSDLAEAERAWREAADGRRRADDQPRLADVQRRLASLYELQGQWPPAIAARQAAATAFAESRLPGEAAAERLSAATHFRSAGRFQEALQLLAVASAEATRAKRWDLNARILGLEGNVRARMGEAGVGLATARAGLALALEHNLVGPAAEIYQRLADSLEHAGDFEAAKNMYLTGFEFCQANASPAVGQVCLACLAVVLRQTGEWERATNICQEVLASPASGPHAVAVSHTVLGLTAALRGGKRRGASRPQLLKGLAVSRSIELAACELLALWGLALADEARGENEGALAHLRDLLTRWHQIEDRHYAVAPLRWAATRFAQMNARPEIHDCADALATMASATGQPEALSALAHALGEAALLEGRTTLAASQFGQALEALDGLELPFDRAHTLLRAGVALAAAGEREAAVEKLVSAYHMARRLQAQPLAGQAAQALADLGEVVEKRVGRRAAAQLSQAGLSARELEVLRQIRLGLTNRDIARALFLSPRTVDMHVRNLLAKLDARSRTEAVSKALELGLMN